ncbi:MAG: hypothetical protein LBD07_04845 [Spirochaetaceae bacterium]|jgi:hypothetical protein|nr:hypothetical protein [Spirochaetaceae bacterium]
MNKKTGLLIIMFFTLIQSVVLQAQSAAFIKRISGQVSVKTKESSSWLPAKENMELTDGTYILTGNESGVLILINNSVISMASLSKALIAFENDSERKKLTVIRQTPVIEIEDEDLVPNPPIGFGKNKRIKLLSPEQTLLSESGQFKSLAEKAGFKNLPVLPKTTSVIIDFISP